jgi:hypothetical protein
MEPSSCRAVQAVTEMAAAARGISIGIGVPEGAELDEQWAVLPGVTLAQVLSARHCSLKSYGHMPAELWAVHKPMTPSMCCQCVSA